MAASQAVLKRRIDWDDGMSHRSCPPLSAPSPLVKRPRLDFHTSNSNESSPTSSRQSPFVIKQFPLESLVDRQKKRVKSRKCQSCGNPEGLPPQEQLFTLTEVQSMIENAVRVASERIKAEYDVILHQQLCDQFNTFTRFNQDYISRQFKKNEISYLS